MEYDVIVVGSGAAGFSSADWLYKSGVKNVLIIAENTLYGTSRNTGSDKQTYYKLSLDGLTPDCAYNMAKDIASGGACDGELAYTEAINSARCFYRLVEYGVPFPVDEFGGYAGYKTDHDNTKRATSMGPYTSKLMTECLERKVIANGTEILNHHLVIKILTKHNNAYGVLALDKKAEKIVKILAKKVIVATGAPACVYKSSVFPQSQHGMSGVLIEAGATLTNFSEWQYGMASTKFRWNVSGSYMQVLPRVVSVDKNGAENEFLLDYYTTPASAYDNLFLKGYQWPFDVNKRDGSSRIDILVQEECNKGNAVYLDYTRNPKGYNFDDLSAETRDYLTKSGATVGTPIERLQVLNPAAISLYMDKKIDISREYLAIAVCAQHNNGGFSVDNNYMTSIDNLYAVGEVAGVFGITRQGGTALNSTQVGGLMASRHIANTIADAVIESGCLEEAMHAKHLFDNFQQGSRADVIAITSEMSAVASFYRDRKEILQLITTIDDLLNKGFTSTNVVEYFRDRDMLISAKALLHSIVGTMDKTGSRGSAMYVVDGKMSPEVTAMRSYKAVTTGDYVTFVKINEVPKHEVWFEKLLAQRSK
ncbi:MAG: FAD-binding protein [Bacillota bacterium]